MSGLYALSVHQPWAAGIVYQGKSPENRGWPVPRQHIGTTIAIHATKAPEFTALWPGGAESWASLFADDDERRAWRTAYAMALDLRGGVKPGQFAHWPRKLTLGAVVGVARIVGCHRCDPDNGWCGEHATEACAGVLCSPWAMPLADWHWELAGARPLATPVPCRGHQKLWVAPDDVERAIRAQLDPDEAESATARQGEK